MDIHPSHGEYKSIDAGERSNELQCARLGPRGVNTTTFRLFEIEEHKPQLLFVFGIDSKMSKNPCHDVACTSLNQDLIHSAILNLVLHIQVDKTRSRNDEERPAMAKLPYFKQNSRQSFEP